ncbi:MAG: tRNA (adenosine(37)-N6)-threonylcarbamoyltransferase complex dimerization subunit type 1 TsaB, partial [Gemmatimonadetes bacterium]|nr:tRNA (adenosine(37)-N6)-threonylcarbamoyltransferase complex dimerization subunit type 1 TsaB [Gemmatimonadota bacterium]NIQ52887.1 tRNA (adenosine(37)-N6)-threonylcarbamoyltransferase complex dimerization subunit type 1 TsaB [Gemmatimonadota bacterium]NIU73015.1 tRNA (adenosine(37)-N6)-threonylcarbamoyltransferase complex dimerization subunit type 1 TsaB [Gammaproteobacteria bacterium]NIX43361.1 tRNA (adenosine(37)-N6)-threonylcarbamoyltransferase complex dimerization subunit type 1 TsaB [Ge
IRVAIETSTPLGSVAVARDDRVLAEVGMGIQTRHAERVLPALEAALETAGAERREIGAVVVGAGPGSFTGVRVAGATAKGLVASLGVPLLAYPSLLALVAATPADGPVCGLFDARRGEVYAGCWRVTERGVDELLAPRVGSAESVVAALGDVTPGPLFVGGGAARYRSELESAGARVASTPAWPRAAALLWLAHHHGAR